MLSKGKVRTAKARPVETSAATPRTNKAVLKALRKMGPRKIIRIATDAGIYTSKGKLTKRYRGPVEAYSRPRAP